MESSKKWEKLFFKLGTREVRTEIRVVEPGKEFPQFTYKYFKSCKFI
jgi:hypothetical protein